LQKRLLGIDFGLKQQQQQLKTTTTVSDFQLIINTVYTANKNLLTAEAARNSC
jgi:hypothetical protein